MGDKVNLRGVRNVEFFQKGKRSRVYIGFIKNEKVAIKVEREDIYAKDRIKNEVHFLKLLNKRKIGPKLISSGKNYIVMEFIEGKRILDWMGSNSKNNILKIIKKILSKCYTLDKLGINKLEFTRPLKHIIIKGSKVKIIDFERCYFTEKPKNLTQFCQFLVSFKIKEIFKEKGIKVNSGKLKTLARKYKKDKLNKNFEDIVNLFN